MLHDQHIASNPALSAWVAASAGTGKTKVLTDRVLRLLLGGARPDKILCITYTKAAAAEMESRIRRELAQWVRMDETALMEELAALTGEAPAEAVRKRARRLFAQVLDAPEGVRIQTIHGFCQSVLARFPLEAGLPPYFRHIDETTARELLEEARLKLFITAQANPKAAEAIAALTARISEATLNELMGRIVLERRKFVEWLEAGPEGASISAALGLGEHITHEALFDKHLRYGAEEEDRLRRAVRALGLSNKPNDQKAFALFHAWCESREDGRVYCDFFFTQTGEPRKDKFFTAEATKHWTDLPEFMKTETQRAAAYREAARTLDVAQMSRHVAVIARTLLENYDGLKKRHAYVDYDDLILYTVRLLHHKQAAQWVLYKLDGGIDHLLVDEAQDTAPEQWKIIHALAAEFFAGEGARAAKRTLFVVGDEKQSIYSFQGARPDAFDAMQRHVAKLAAGAGADYRRVRLGLSFRSTAPILKAVDEVFAQPEAREGLIFSEADIRHEVHRIGMAGRVELWPLVENPDEEKLPAWHVPTDFASRISPETITARSIADRIDSWLKSGRVLASRGRPVKPGDILILVQQRRRFSSVMLRALKRKNIPVAGTDRLVLTGHIAIEDLMGLARFLLLPQDDLTLAAVLKSPFIGLSEEALFTLAHDRGGATLWARLKEFGASSQSYGEAYSLLSDLLARTDYMPPYELFAYLLEAKDGRKKLAMRLGSEIEDPINEFLALAIEHGQTHAPSLQGFLHWLEAGATEIKRDMEKGIDAVRILTVHGAKGLQAPVVFLFDTTRTPPHEGGILWTQGEPSVPLWSLASGEDRHYRALKEAARTEREREYRRLLYVAMTRAEDELYIGGWKGSKAISPQCWYALVDGAARNWNEEEGKRVLQSPQTAAPQSESPTAEGAPATALPDWTRQAAPYEPAPPRPLTPSRLETAGDVLDPYAAAARARGSLIHRLLQFLPEQAPERREAAMRLLFDRFAANLSEEEREQIRQEVLAILGDPEFAPVFGPGSIAEASIAGVLDGAQPVVMAGRIDRIAVLQNDVYIIDYKTNRKVPRQERDVPVAYLRQMEAYRKLAAMIYPHKTVHCALLWTAEPRLMILPVALLSTLAA